MMKLKKDFIVHKTADEYLIVPLGGTSFSGVVRGNETAGVIFECLKKSTDVDKITAELVKRFNAPEDQARKDVKSIISQLNKIGAIER